MVLKKIVNEFDKKRIEQAKKGILAYNRELSREEGKLVKDRINFIESIASKSDSPEVKKKAMKSIEEVIKKNNNLIVKGWALNVNKKFEEDHNKQIEGVHNLTKSLIENFSESELPQYKLRIGKSKIDALHLMAKKTEFEDVVKRVVWNMESLSKTRNFHPELKKYAERVHSKIKHLF
jgi:hypothetical protein